MRAGPDVSMLSPKVSGWSAPALNSAPRLPAAPLAVVEELTGRSSPGATSLLPVGRSSSSTAPLTSAGGGSFGCSGSTGGITAVGESSSTSMMNAPGAAVAGSPSVSVAVTIDEKSSCRLSSVAGSGWSSWPWSWNDQLPSALTVSVNTFVSPASIVPLSSRSTTPVRTPPSTAYSTAWPSDVRAGSPDVSVLRLKVSGPSAPALNSAPRLPAAPLDRRRGVRPEGHRPEQRRCCRWEDRLRRPRRSPAAAAGPRPPGAVAE